MRGREGEGDGEEEEEEVEEEEEGLWERERERERERDRERERERERGRERERRRVVESMFISAGEGPMARARATQAPLHASEIGHETTAIQPLGRTYRSCTTEDMCACQMCNVKCAVATETFDRDKCATETQQRHLTCTHVHLTRHL